MSSPGPSYQDSPAPDSPGPNSTDWFDAEEDEDWLEGNGGAEDTAGTPGAPAPAPPADALAPTHAPAEAAPRSPDPPSMLDATPALEDAGPAAPATPVQASAGAEGGDSAASEGNKAEEAAVEEEDDDAQPQEPFPVHRAAFNGQEKLLRRLVAGLTPEQLKQHDAQGNTPLHCAVLRRKARCAAALLEAGAPPGARNARGWAPLMEAVELGCKQMALTLAKAEVAQMRAAVKAKKSAMLQLLRTELPDFNLQLKWELGSGMPGVGSLIRRYAPHDTYTLWKKGGRIRVDGTLMGLDDHSPSLVPEWKRGHFSLLYDATGAKGRATFINHTDKKYIDVKAAKKQLGMDEASALEAEVDMLMTSEVLQIKKLRSVDFKFKPVAGWLSKEVREKVEGWKCKLYEASGRMVSTSRYKMPLGLPANLAFDDYLTLALEPDPLVESPVNPLNPMARNEERGTNPEKAAAKAAVAAKHARIAAAASAQKDLAAALLAKAAAARAAAGARRALEPTLDFDPDGEDGEGPDGEGDERTGQGEGGARETGAGAEGKLEGERGSRKRVDATVVVDTQGGSAAAEGAAAGGAGPGEEEEEDLQAWAQRVAEDAAVAKAARLAEEDAETSTTAVSSMPSHQWGSSSVAGTEDLSSTGLTRFSSGTAKGAVGGRGSAHGAGAGGGPAAAGAGGGTKGAPAAQPKPRFLDRFGRGSQQQQPAQDAKGGSAAGSSAGGKAASAASLAKSPSGKGKTGLFGRFRKRVSESGGAQAPPAANGAGSATGGSASGAAAEAAAAGAAAGADEGAGVAGAGGAAGLSAAAKKARKLTGKCWMAEDFPLSLHQLLPLLEVIGTANKVLGKVARFLRKYGELDMFPVKVQVPLLFTIYALLSFKAFKLLGSGAGCLPCPDDSFFEIPPDYEQGELEEFSGHLQQRSSTRPRQSNTGLHKCSTATAGAAKEGTGEAGAAAGGGAGDPSGAGGAANAERTSCSGEPAPGAVEGGAAGGAAAGEEGVLQTRQTADEALAEVLAEAQVDPARKAHGKRFGGARSRKGKGLGGADRDGPKLSLLRGNVEDDETGVAGGFGGMDFDDE